MFSRIFKSARALLIDRPQNPDFETQPKHKQTTPNRMVTSRSQTRKAGELNDNTTENAHVSSSSKKRSQCTLAEDLSRDDEGTPSAKRRKTLPVREKGATPVMVAKSRLVVEIPVRRVTPKPDTQNGSQEKPIEIEDDDESSDPGSEDEVEVEGVERSGVEAWTEEAAKEEGEPIAKVAAHKRFDSEAPEPEFFSTAREPPDEVADSVEDRGEDSDDEAPEAIGIQQAAEEVRSRARNTAKAVKEQVSATRQKRKERDWILKKQSAAGKKRKLEPAAVVPTPQPDRAPSAHEDAVEPRPAFDEPRLTSCSALPDFLPAEYLEEDTEPRDVAIASARADGPKPRKMRFLEAKAPKDKRVGSTTYRVAPTGRADLAPKADVRAKSLKEKWLQGRSGMKAEPHRRPFGKAVGRT